MAKTVHNSNLECSMKTATKHYRLHIKASELAKRKQRSQVKQSRSLSVSRTPSHDGWSQVEAEIKDRTNKSLCSALTCIRKLNRGTNSEGCRDRKLNYGNKLPSQTTIGLCFDCTFNAQSHSPLLTNRCQFKSYRLKRPQLNSKLPKLIPSFRVALQYLFVVGAILWVNLAIPTHSKSIDDSPSQRANFDKSFVATLQPSIYSALSEVLRQEPSKENPTTRSSSLEANVLHSATTATTTTNQDDTSSQDDDNDVEGCQGISVGDAAEAKNYTDNERLVNLQTCIQRKIERRLNGAKRFGLEMFEKLSISGGCSSSIMRLVGSLNEIKSFSFKFLDATAKIPSGVMYGLLSDFGDFDQCLSIRSNPKVRPEDEAEEGGFSGKYCLVSVKLNYHARLEGNSTVPEGIIEDGVLWDEIVRNYWTTKSPKGFMAGVCLPSRCTRDDLDQIYRYVADHYNVVGGIINCQDSLDLKKQYKPDFIQHFIIYSFYLLVSITLLGTVIDRYYPISVQNYLASDKRCSLAANRTDWVRLLLCFSIRRNWRLFMSTSNPNSNNWDCMIGADSMGSTPDNSSDFNENTSVNSQVQNERVLADPKDDEKTENLDKRPCDQLDVQTRFINCADSKAKMSDNQHQDKFKRCSLQHLSGLRLLVIIWITIGHSFLYPSANNYQYYRSIINMNITRDSVWFATTNFTLGIDMLLYMTGLMFVYKLAHLSCTFRSLSPSSTLNIKSPSRAYRTEERHLMKFEFKRTAITRLLLKKMLKFWPTYLTLIGIAILVPLLSDGPMWPEMVSKRLGDSCRRNWWSNLLFINNILNESNICLPSSWFVSILMQLFLSGSLVILIVRRSSLKVALILLTVLLTASSGLSFAFAFLSNVRAPMIRMDESFVMELDENIFRIYTTLFNNLGPFLVGMIGGYLLIYAELTQSFDHLSELSSTNTLSQATTNHSSRFNLKNEF